MEDEDEDGDITDALSADADEDEEDDESEYDVNEEEDEDGEGQDFIEIDIEVVFGELSKGKSYVTFQGNLFVKYRDSNLVPFFSDLLNLLYSCFVLCFILPFLLLHNIVIFIVTIFYFRCDQPPVFFIYSFLLSSLLLIILYLFSFIFSPFSFPLPLSSHTLFPCLFPHICIVRPEGLEFLKTTGRSR